MANIYDQHRAAFANVSAFVILTATGETAATVALKCPREGAGRLYAYVHISGLPMVRGWADGGGYDKRSAAVASACARAKDTPYTPDDDAPAAVRDGWKELNAQADALAAAWRERAPRLDAGRDWTRALEREGFRVVQAA